MGACTSNDLRRYQKKHGILLIASEQNAQYIQCGDVLYHDKWMLPYAVAVPCHEADVEEIEESEYTVLMAALEQGNEIAIEPEPPDIAPEPLRIDPIDEITLECVKKSKISEMSAKCQKTIAGGFDIILSDGESHHFSLTMQDQLNLITLSSMVDAGEALITYHADGEPCREFPAGDITKIINAADAFKTYHLTYYNALKGYIGGMDDIKEIGVVTYGAEIPEEYMTEVLKKVPKEWGEMRRL